MGPIGCTSRGLTLPRGDGPVSRTPAERIGLKKRMGWRFKWMSSYGHDSGEAVLAPDGLGRITTSKGDQQWVDPSFTGS
jgi:hypothetical protein